MRSKATMRWAPTWAPTWMPESAYPRRWKIEDSGPPVGRVLARRGRPSFPWDSANLWRSGLRSQIADSAGREAIGRLNAQRGITVALLQHRCQRPKWPMCLSLWTKELDDDEVDVYVMASQTWPDDVLMSNLPKDQLTGFRKSSPPGAIGVCEGVSR